jgi:heat shock protein HslJ
MTLLRVVLALVVAAAATNAEAQSRRRGGDDQQKTYQGEKPPPKEQKIFPTKTSWIAVSLNGKGFPGERPSFVLDEQFRIRGFGGCNTFSAVAYPLREQHFAVGPFALTKKSCDKAIMDSEHSFLVALRTSALWDTVGGQLVIKGQNGELKFERSL